jgi:hypothetical protein
MWRAMLTALGRREEPLYTLAMRRRDVELVHHAYLAARIGECSGEQRSQ